MKRYIVLIVCLVAWMPSLFANDSTKVASPLSVSLELSTKYMWRGIEYGTAPVAFPMLSYGYKGFNAFAMGAYAVNGSHQEVDLVTPLILSAKKITALTVRISTRVM